MTITTQESSRRLEPTFLFFGVRLVDTEGNRGLFSQEIEVRIPQWVEATQNNQIPAQFDNSPTSKIVILKAIDAGDGITFLHFCRYNSSIHDTDIVDKDTNDVTKIKRMAALRENHAAIHHCMCAYDSQTRLFTWQKNEKISLSAISSLLTWQLLNEIDLVPATYANSIGELPKINAEKLRLSMNLRNAAGGRELILNENNLADEAGIRIYRKLKELIDEFDGVEIDVIIKSLENSPEGSLNESKLTTLARAFKNLFPANEDKIDMIVRGHLKDEFSPDEIDISETRVIDIYDNLLSIGLTCNVNPDDTIIEKFPVLENCVRQACIRVREVANV